MRLMMRLYIILMPRSLSVRVRPSGRYIHFHLYNKLLLPTIQPVLPVIQRT